MNAYIFNGILLVLTIVHNEYSLITKVQDSIMMLNKCPHVCQYIPAVQDESRLFIKKKNAAAECIHDVE